MEHKHMIATFSVLALVIAGMFVFAYLKKSEIAEAPAVTPPIVQDNGPYGSITRINAKHFFIEPTHTIAGEIPMPTPCDLLNWKTRVLESVPDTVFVDFDVVNHAETCAEVITAQRFLVPFDAPQNTTIRATLNGREVELNLIPAAEGETPEDFEIFLKG